MDAGPARGTWTERDSILWQTCAWVAAAVGGQEVVPRGTVLTNFAPQGGPDDVLLCAGPFERLTFRALGNGTYDHNGGFFFATGRLGIAVSAGVLLARGLTNHARRTSAAQAAVPRWVVEEQGTFTVGTRGFHLSNSSGVFYWGWGAITSITITGPGYFEMFGESTNGPVHWTFATPWAELIFALWALTCHPRHPQLVTGQWLPSGFLQWVAQHGYEPPLAGPSIQLER